MRVPGGAPVRRPGRAVGPSLCWEASGGEIPRWRAAAPPTPPLFRGVGLAWPHPVGAPNPTAPLLQCPASQEHPGLQASTAQELSLRAPGSGQFTFCISGLTMRPGRHAPVLHFETGPCLSAAPSSCLRSLIGDPGPGLLTFMSAPSSRERLLCSRS